MISPTTSPRPRSSMLRPRQTLLVLSLGLCLVLAGGYAGAGTGTANLANRGMPEAHLGPGLAGGGEAGLQDWGLRLPESVTLFLFGSSLIVAARSYRGRVVAHA